MLYFYVYLIIINIIAFALFWIDKIKAKRNLWRIPEKVLLGFGFIGGALGGILAMGIFRHKTKKPKFIITMPVFLIIHLAAIAFCIYKGIITF